MLSTPTQTQIDTYRENGFLVIENFLNPTELEHWQTVTDDAVEKRLTETTGKPWIDALSNQNDPDAFYAQVFIQCVRLADTHERMRKLIYDPRLGEFAATLAGIEGIRVWHDQALYKPPYGNPTGWHLDNPYWSFDSRDSLSIWVALDDATLGNGCLWYIPGSQREARWENAGIGQNMADLFRIYPEWRSREAIACPCPAGSAVFHSGMTAHGAGANMTPRPRRAMTCAYMPDGSVYNGRNRNILPDRLFDILKAGDPLNDPDFNPLIWKRGSD